MSTAVIVLAAGKGTRMKSKLPKVLHPILGRPLVAWPLAAAASIKPDALLAVVGHGAEQVSDELKSFFPELLFAEQKEQNGTGHATQIGLQHLLASGSRTEHILVLCGDTPLLRGESLQALIQKHSQESNALTLFTTETDHPAGYGRMKRVDGEISSIVEYKDATEEERNIREINPGIYCFETSFLEAELKNLSTDNVQGELYLTDLVAAAAKQNRLADLPVDFTDTLGINDRKQFAEARVVLRDRILSRWMMAGVTVMDPESTTIESDVILDMDVTLHPNVHLYGNTTIASDVEIHTGCVLTNTAVSEGAKLMPYSVFEDAKVGKNAQIGPYARLRPLADIGEGAKIGNFVEVKKARFGKGAKANHLAYIGDAEIGAGSNIGAGTITCNYDGAGKHKTELGEGVFVGSNSTLVAPLEIADGAYIAAGSCIVSTVPKDALAIARARQSNKEGYAEKIRERNLARKNK